MNVRLVPAFLLLASLPHFAATAQHQHETQSGDTARSRTMSDRMAKATFEKTLDGYRLQVWVITQEEHKQMMKTMMGGGEMKHDMKGMGRDMEGMKHDMKGMDMEAMTSGTHHFMVTLTDSATNKSPEKAEVEVAVQSPSKKKSHVELAEMMGQYGGSLVLDEKGEYLLTIHSTIAGEMRHVQFNYVVKQF